MEQHCRGEYERSFLQEFQEVKDLRVLAHRTIIGCFVSYGFCVNSGWNWCWAG